MPFLRWLKIGADSVAVLLLAAMFCSFMLQIIFRYIFNHPLSWTLEACLITWLWTVFWGCGLLLRDHDHVRFDVLYGCSAQIASFDGWSGCYRFPGCLRVFTSSNCGLHCVHEDREQLIMKIRLDYIFGIYLLFMIGVIGRYLWRLVQILRDQDFEAGISHSAEHYGE